MRDMEFLIVILGFPGPTTSQCRPPFSKFGSMSDCIKYPTLKGHVLEHRQVELMIYISGHHEPEGCDLARPLTAIHVELCIATIYVLTLSTRTDGPATALTRQRILQQQFSDAGCHIVALQETRHKRLVDMQNEFYHLIGHCADARGQDGIQLWVTKTKPLLIVALWWLWNTFQ